MSCSCEHLEEFKKTNLDEYRCLYSCVIASNSKQALKAKAAHSSCIICRKTWKLHACMYCVFIGCYDRKHIQQHLSENSHALSIDLSHGYVFCSVCGDFVYDTELDAIAMRCRRKSCALLGISEPYYYWVPTDLEIRLLQNKERKRVVEHSFLGLCGLCNLGNTCYINCILQTMIHMPILRDYFLSLKHQCGAPGEKVELEKTNQPCLMCELSHLFQEFYSGKSAVISPCRVYHSMWDRCSVIHAQAQVDAHEFLNGLLDIMHDNCSGPDGENVLNKHKNNIIDLVFNGRHQSDITCEVCKHVSSTVENFRDISVEVKFNEFIPPLKSAKSSVNGKSEDYTLEQCIARYTAEEHLNESEVYCQNCDKKRKSTKQITFITLPNIICFHLKRFEKHNKEFKKIDTPVVFPFELDMTKFLNSYVKDTRTKDISSLVKHKYRLFAVVEHKGNVENGHYLAYVRQCANQWFKCDDHKVTLVKLEDVLEVEGYLLFYHKETINYE